MPTVIAEAVLFLSSFAPLFLVFGLLDSFGGGAASLACYGIALVSVLFLLLSLRIWRKLSTMRVTIARARQRDADAIGYVATYVVPFAALGVDTWRSRTAVLLFLLLVGLLYIRAHLFYVNPILSALGYRIFEAETGTGRLMLVISRRSYIQVNTQIDVRTLSDYTFIEANAAPGPPQSDRRRSRAGVGR